MFFITGFSNIVVLSKKIDDYQEKNSNELKYVSWVTADYSTSCPYVQSRQIQEHSIGCRKGSVSNRILEIEQ